MTDQATCGYNEFFAGPCRGVREPTPSGELSLRCTEHNHPRYAICIGCSGAAVGECRGAGTAGHPCLAAICADCEHRLTGEHGPLGGAEPGPFAAQRPEAKVANTARAGMIEVVERTLGRAVATGLLRFRDDPEGIGVNTVGYGDELTFHSRVASLVVDDLTAETFARVLAGIAAGQVSG